MTPEHRPPGPRAARREATMRRILEAAWALARERGLTGWTLRDLGSAVGMRAPSLYVYVDSKHALYDALFADGYTALLDRIDAVPREGTPRDVVLRAARLFVDFCAEDGPRTHLLFLRTVPGFEPTPAAYALAERVLAELATVLADAGVEDPRDLDLWTAMLTGLALQQASNDPGGDRWTRLIDETVDLLLPR